MPVHFRAAIRSVHDADICTVPAPFPALAGQSAASGGQPSFCFSRRRGGGMGIGSAPASPPFAFGTAKGAGGASEKSRWPKVPARGPFLFSGRELANLGVRKKRKKERRAGWRRVEAGPDAVVLAADLNHRAACDFRRRGDQGRNPAITAKSRKLASSGLWISVTDSPMPGDPRLPFAACRRRGVTP
jgi:hypothetical protein